MDPLTSLERAALDAIIDEMAGEQAEAAREGLTDVGVIARENTGGGFFTDLRVDASKLFRSKRHHGDLIWMSVEGLDFGLAMILHLKDDQSALLEGYAVGAEDTAEIPFEHVRFAVATAPGPLVTNDN